MRRDRLDTIAAQLELGRHLAVVTAPSARLTLLTQVADHLDTLAMPITTRYAVGRESISHNGTGGRLDLWTPRQLELGRGRATQLAAVYLEVTISDEARASVMPALTAYGGRLLEPAEDVGPMHIEAASSCNVTNVASTWRNGPHWHTVWPEGSTWCYPTPEEAAARAVEVAELRASHGLDRQGRA